MSAGVQRAQAIWALARPPAGRPLDEVTDPFALEVHRPVQPEDPQPGLPVLPAYVPREHDRELGRVVRAAAEGSSGIAVLVGGSSTGKTRACWEALQLLRDQPEPWRLWHPIDPSRPDAALRELPAIGPRTVVWLNEAQFYLDVADGGLGERVAAGLRELLRDPARAPVLVLATLWPQFWDGLTARPAGGADPHAQARELLAGHDITVPAAFTAAQLQRLSQAGDARLAQAAAGAQDGQVIQFLAGAPELLARYRNAPPAAAALIHAAMDARRLGMGIGLPQAFLEAAAPGYLTDAEWDALGEDWLEQALAYTAVPCKGVRGPLTRIRPRPARSRATGPGSRDGDEQLAGGQAGIRAGRCTGSRITSISTAGTTGRARFPRQASGPQRPTTPPPATRPRSVMPPTLAACTVTPPSSTKTPPPAATSALFSTSATLRTTSALTSAPCAGPPPTSPSTTRTPWPGCWTGCGRRARRSRSPRCCAVIPPPTSPSTTRTPWPGCWTALREAGAAGAGHRAGRAAPPPTSPSTTRRRGQAAGQPAGGGRAGAGHRAGRPRRRPRRPRRPGRRGRAAGQPAGGGRGRSRPPRCWPVIPPPTSPSTTRARVAWLLDSLREAGAEEQAAALLARDPAAHAPLDDPHAVAGLLDSLREAGAQSRSPRWPSRAAAHVALDDPGARGRAAGQPAGGGRGGAGHRAGRPAAAHVALDDPGAVAGLLDSLREAGAEEQATALLRRDPPPTSPSTTRRGVAGCWTACGRRAREQVAALLARIRPPTPPSTTRAAWPGCWTACGRRARRSRPPRCWPVIPPPTSPSTTRAPWPGCWTACGRRARASRPPRWPSAPPPTSPSTTRAPWPGCWTACGRRAQQSRPPRWPSRAAAHVALDNPRAVAGLLDSLRASGAAEQAAALADRLPGAGMFELFRGQEGRQDRFRFGREADGRPAGLWGWADLD